MNTSHNFKRKCALLASALAVGTLSSVYGAFPNAIISNGTVSLGVDNGGNLNIPGPVSFGGVPVVGLRLNNPVTGTLRGLESTSPGCVCEGWGAADSITGNRVFYNNDSGAPGGGNGGLPVFFTSTATTASSIVSTGGKSANTSFPAATGPGGLGGGPGKPGSMNVYHDYYPSISPNLYEVLVTVENTSSAPEHILYRRVMDWDVEPTPFSEYVTMSYTALGGNLAGTSNDGFTTSDPLGPLTGGFVSPVYINTPFTDKGPADHGALFQFDFGILAAGDTISFKTYYGAAPTEAAALAALTAVGAEAFSLGQSSGPGGPGLGTPATHIFAFGDIGLPPAPIVPEPSTVVGGIALAGLAAGRILRRKKS